jgi:hypothetical protein
VLRRWQRLQAGRFFSFYEFGRFGKFSKFTAKSVRIAFLPSLRRSWRICGLEIINTKKRVYQLRHPQSVLSKPLTC